MSPQLQASVAKVVTEIDEIPVAQLATIFVAVLGTFTTHGRELHENIVEQMGDDKEEEYGEGLSWLEDLVKKED